MTITQKRIDRWTESIGRVGDLVAVAAMALALACTAWLICAYITLEASLSGGAR